MKSNPTNFRRGMTLFEVLLVVAVILVLLAILLPAVIRQKTSYSRPTRIRCVNNLKQVALSFKTWAIDNGDKYPMQLSTSEGGSMELIGSGHTFPHFQILSNELSTPRLLICPDDVVRTPALSRTPPLDFQTGFNDSTISYFVGVDSNDTNPFAFFVGDSHLAIGGVPVKSGLLELWTNAPVEWTAARHGGAGNIGLADGSVQQVSYSNLKRYLAETGVVTNRLSIP